MAHVMYDAGRAMTATADALQVSRAQAARVVAGAAALRQASANATSARARLVRSTTGCEAAEARLAAARARLAATRARIAKG